MTGRVRLGVNIDHVATIRNARGGSHPDIARAAEVATKAGADGITFHLREDRRHIMDPDLQAIRAATDLPLNMETAATDEMHVIAMDYKPETVMFVPEKREERTTEGGLDVAAQHRHIAPFVDQLSAAGCRVSLFIEADPVQIAVAEALGAAVVELHTGAYAEAWLAGDREAIEHHLTRLRRSAEEGEKRGLEIHAGHGLTFDCVKPVAAIPEVAELNIGHFLVGEAIFSGLHAAVKRMRSLMDEARSEAAA